MLSAVAFDLYGTIIDLASAQPKMAEVYKRAEEILPLWREKQLQYTLLLSMMGRYEAFSWITKRALLYALKKKGINLDEGSVNRLMSVWLQLEPFPEVKSVLGTLRRSYKLAVLTNGDMPMVSPLLIGTRLDSYFNYVISADEASCYKPSRKVYRLAGKRMDCKLKDILMVSANSFDVIGAKSAGMMVAWVRRGADQLDELGFNPDYEVGSLEALLVELSKIGRCS